MAHRIAHAINAEYGVAVGLVACAGYSVSSPMAQLLMRLGEYNRQSEALRVTSRRLTAGGRIFGMVTC